MAREETIEMFSSALSEIANGPYRGTGSVTSHADLTERLLRRLAEKGLTLEECCDRRIMKRSRRTLEGYCRRFEIKFPDYTPMSMRERKRKDKPEQAS